LKNAAHVNQYDFIYHFTASYCSSQYFSFPSVERMPMSEG